MIALGLLLLPMLAVAAIADYRFGTTWEYVTITPDSVDELQPAYRIASGNITIDLSRLDLAGELRPDVDAVPRGRLVRRPAEPRREGRHPVDDVQRRGHPACVQRPGPGHAGGNAHAALIVGAFLAA